MVLSVGVHQNRPDRALITDYGPCRGILSVFESLARSSRPVIDRSLVVARTIACHPSVASACSVAQNPCVPRSTLDEIDRRLLGFLQQDASATLTVLGEAVGLSASAVHRRIRRYQASGVITGQTAVLNPKAVGSVVTSITLVEIDRERASPPALHQFRQKLLASAAVQQIFELSGEYASALVCVSKDSGESKAANRELFRGVEIVKRHTTLPVDEVLKASLWIPLEHRDRFGEGVEL